MYRTSEPASAGASSFSISSEGSSDPSSSRPPRDDVSSLFSEVARAAKTLKKELAKPKRRQDAEALAVAQLEYRLCLADLHATLVGEDELTVEITISRARKVRS